MSKDSKNPYLQHSWGKTADQKRKEQEYNRRYYDLHKKDKWGVGEETRQAPSTSENVSSNRPMARQKNVTEGGNGVQRRGEGLNTGSVGTDQYGRSEVVGAVRDKKNSPSSIEADESRRYARDRNMLNNRRDKNWERYSNYEAQGNTPEVQKEIDAGTWDRDKYLKYHGYLPQKVEDEAVKAERDLKALASKRRASAMARTAQAQAVPPSQINTNASPYGRPVQKVNPYKSDAYANSARTNGVAASPSSIEARKTAGRYQDRRAASSAARSNAAAESEQARMSVSEAKIRKRNAAMARAAAAAESAQAHQQVAKGRYDDFKKSKTYEMQEQAKRKDVQEKAAYQERQNEVKKAISKKNGIQNEITNINNTIKRLQKEDPKGNAIKINSLYKQLDDKKTAYKNMQAYINALNF